MSQRPQDHSMSHNDAGRRCRQCGERIIWGSARFVGSRVFCWEPCAIVWLLGAASRTAWSRIRWEMDRQPRNFRWRLQLAWLSLAAAAAQRRLDRRLRANSEVEDLPWFWIPSLRGTTALILTLAACGISGARAPEPGILTAMPDGPTLSVQAPAAPSPAVDVGRSQNTLPPEIVPPSLGSPVEPAPPPAPAERHAPARSRPAPRATAEDIKRGDLSRREVALTFDGGSEANVVGEILDSLRAANVRVTVFLTGQFIRLHPDWVRRMAADGHEIANHTDTHPHLTTYATNHRQHTLPNVTRDFVVGQLRRAEESLRTLTGKAMAPLWRAPYGEHNGEIRAWAAEAGYRHISWTQGAGTAEDLDTRDWVADRSSRIYRSREQIAARILEFGTGRPEGLSGGIVLMHLHSNRQTDRPHDGLPDLLKALQGQGYRVVTISRLLERFRTDQEQSGPALSPPAADGQSPR
jgi:peptidoglycan/xylan/chitin deacetylase (PgdA/CDA1 family)